MSQSARLRQRYIEALDLCAVVVMSPSEAASPVRLIVSSTVPIADKETAPAYSTWCARTHQAMFLRGHCIDSLTASGVRMVRTWLDTDVATAREGLDHAAAYLGIATTSIETIEKNAAAAVSRIKEAVEAMRISGGLKQLNTTYKAHRLQAERNGTKAMTYPAFLGRFVEGITVLVAAGARQIPGGEFGDLRDRKLGQLGVDGLSPEYIFRMAGAESSAQKA